MEIFTGMQVICILSTLTMMGLPGLTGFNSHPQTDIDEVGLDMHGWNYGAPVILSNGKVMVSFTKIQPTTVPGLL